MAELGFKQLKFTQSWNSSIFIGSVPDIYLSQPMIFSVIKYSVIIWKPVLFKNVHGGQIPPWPNCPLLTLPVFFSVVTSGYVI